jgi:hypothetical protein
MPRTIDLADVVPPEVWESGGRLSGHRAPAGEWNEYTSAFEGLSSFNIPTRIELVPDREQVVFRFSYPDSEPGERVREPVPGRPDVRVLLGAHTKKILEIAVSNLHRFLVLEKGKLPEDGIAALAAEYPSRIQKVLTRNARLISGLFSSLPEATRSRIHQTLSAAQRELQVEKAG